MIIRPLFFYFSLLFSTAACGVISNLFKLDIVHYNDFHARYEETSIKYAVCKTNDSQCLGGFARMYYELAKLMEEKPDALLLNAGDTFQGTYWYSYLKWNVTQKFINLLPNDAHALGNHEFDDGIPGLVPYLKALKAPILVANIDVSDEPSMQGLTQPSIVVERQGRKIGIIGLITTETALSSRPGNVIFLDPIETTRKIAQNMTDQGIDIIILLSHCGLPIDKRIAEEAGENIDVIVGGHSHSLLWNGTAPLNLPTEGPYPYTIESKANRKKHKVLIVTASAFSKFVGNLSVYFDEHGEIQQYDGGPILLNRSIPEDPNIKAMLQPYTDELKKIVDMKIGFSIDSLPVTPCQAGECALGNICADALVNATIEMGISDLPIVSIILRNHIRGNLPKGTITRGDIISIVPFSQAVMTFVLKGRYLKEIIDRTMIKHWTDKPFQGPWLPQVSGLKLVMNATSNQSTSILVVKGESLEPLDMEADYQVTTFTFLSEGGSGFKMIKEHAKNMTKVGADRDIIEKYFTKLSPITPSEVLDNRLTIEY